MFLSAGQTSDYIGARALLSSIPQAGALLGDRGYDADWFRNALIDMGILPCIPLASVARCRSRTRTSTAYATRSKTCSPG